MDALLDKLTREYGLNLPVTDLLVTDPCASLLANVRTGDNLGTHLAAGLACRHLAFTQKNADWQLWIENGKEPLPRKLVITDKTKMGWPQYAVTFQSFDFHPRLPAKIFTFTPAKAARKIDFVSPASGPGTGK